jgi:hypothetical protein
MESESGEITYADIEVWLRSPTPEFDVPVEQDWDLYVADGLQGDFPGHIDFYLHETIPSPLRRRYLLNALYVMAWTRFQHRKLAGSIGETAQTSLQAGLNAAKASGREELLRWADAVERQLRSRWRPRYRFWCMWGWRSHGGP